MIALSERLLPLWTQPVDARDAPEAAFREVYADPVVVNGTEMTITELAGRARSLQRAFNRLDMHILDTGETPDRIVVAFLMRGRHVGPFISPIGGPSRPRSATLRCARSTFWPSPPVLVVGLVRQRGGDVLEGTAAQIKHRATVVPCTGHEPRQMREIRPESADA